MVHTMVLHFLRVFCLSMQDIDLTKAGDLVLEVSLTYSWSLSNQDT